MSMTIDDRAMLALFDHVTKGAASHYIDVATTHLRPIREAALPSWPERTSKSKAALEVKGRVTETGAEAMLVDDVDYGYKVKWSRLTAKDIAEEVERMTRPATTSQGKAKLKEYWTRYLRKQHGEGAPTEALAGKHVWTELIRKPAKAAEPDLIRKVQADLSRLAGAD